MPEPFDMGAMLERAESLPGSEAAQVADSLPPGEQATNLNAVTEGAPSTESEPSGGESADTGTAGDQIEEEPKAEPLQDEPAADADITQVRQWGKGLETDLKETRREFETVQPVVEFVEQAGGLDTIKPLIDPLLAENPDVDSFADSFIEQRGVDAYRGFAWGVYDRHQSAFITEALSHPERITNPEIRAAVEQFNSWRESGTPTSTAREEAIAPAEDDDLDDLPEAVRTELLAHRKRQTAIEAKLAELDGYKQKSEEQKQEEARRAQEAQVSARESELEGILSGVVDNDLSKVAFSTAIDPAARDEENARIQGYIRAAVLADLRAHPRLQEIGPKLREQFVVRGDRLGSRGMIAEAKKIIHSIKENHIRWHEAKYGTKTSTPTESTPPKERPNLTGGTGAPLQPAAPRTHKPFDPAYLEQRAASLPPVRR